MTPEERTKLQEWLCRSSATQEEREEFLAIIAPGRAGRRPVTKDANGYSDTIHAQARIWNFYLDSGNSLKDTLARYEDTAGVTTVETVCKAPDAMGRPRRARAEVYRCAKILREADDTLIPDELM